MQTPSPYLPMASTVCCVSLSPSLSNAACALCLYANAAAPLLVSAARGTNGGLEGRVPHCTYNPHVVQRSRAQ